MSSPNADLRRGIGATNRAVAGENDDGVGKALQDQRIGAAVLLLQGGAGGEAAGQTLDLAAERGHQHRGLGFDDRAGLVRADAAHLIDQQIQVAPPDQGEDAGGHDADHDARHRRPEVRPLRGGQERRGQPPAPQRGRRRCRAPSSSPLGRWHPAGSRHGFSPLARRAGSGPVPLARWQRKPVDPAPAHRARNPACPSTGAGRPHRRR